MIVGLLPALGWLISDPDRQFDITIGTAVQGQEPRLPPEVELILFRVAREGRRIALPARP
jgi:signal transduction histidine kinase